MSSPFDKLFPQDLLEIANTILKLKRSYDNSVPKLLTANGYFKQGKNIYVHHFKNIILFYSKSDCKKRRPEVFNELLRIGELWQNRYQAPTPHFQGRSPLPELIYGTLSGVTENPVVLYNAVINIMSGESLLRYLFGSDEYNTIICKISDAIDNNFHFGVTPNEQSPLGTHPTLLSTTPTEPDEARTQDFKLN